jgi:hypothetical protein
MTEELYKKNCDSCHSLVIPKTIDSKTKEFKINGPPICGITGTETAGLTGCPLPQLRDEAKRRKGRYHHV